MLEPFAFDNLEDAFFNNQKEHADYLLPWAKLTQSTGPLKGIPLPLIVPYSDACGEEPSDRHSSYWCRPGWLGFRLKGSQVELESDLHFLTEDPVYSMEEKNRIDESYQIYKDIYNAKKYIPQSPNKTDSIERRNLSFESEDGKATGSDWVIGFPNETWVEDSEYLGAPINPNGKQLHFLGLFCQSIALGSVQSDSVVFYDQEFNILLFGYIFS